MQHLNHILGRVKPSKPQVLEKDDIPSIAKYIKSDKCKNVFLMVGAGISTSAGIPDFRSPDTGLYANLARLKLPYPEAVFDIRYFRENPQPFYTLAAELYPGYYRPTVTHSFIRLLAEKGKLHTVFTQNIDTLERIAGVPLDKIMEAHGSFATQRCIDCEEVFPDDEMKAYIKDAKIPHCKRKGCNGLVKPDIVFFGEALPDEFESKVANLKKADLLIIAGTSLTVYPFAALRQMVPASCPRILINLDRVGDIGSRSDDVVLQMACDDAVRKLCDALGGDWREELERLWKETENSYTPKSEEEEKKTVIGKAEEPASGNLAKNEALEDEIARIAGIVADKMKLEDGEEKKGGEKASSKPATPAVDDSAAWSTKTEPPTTEPPTETTSETEETVETTLSSKKDVPDPESTPHYEDGALSVPETKHDEPAVNATS